jgi:integrase
MKDYKDLSQRFKTLARKEIMREFYPGVNTVRKKLANKREAVYYYHRATQTKLEGEPGSSAFHDSYVAADRIAPNDTGTLSQLIRGYRGSRWFHFTRKKKLPRPESTKKEYTRLLDRVEDKFGTMPIQGLAAKSVIGKFLNWQEEIGRDHPREADARLAMLSTVLNYAKTMGKIARNPLDGFEHIHFADRSDLIWLEADIRLFMEGASIELQRAFIIALHLGQRYGDLIRLRWCDYDGIRIALKQGKTGAKVNVKVTAALKRMLDAIPRVGPYILTRDDGRPWFTSKDDGALGKAWRARMKETGLFSDSYLAETRNEPELAGKRLRLNDVRGTSVTLLSEAECTLQQVCSVTGHTLKSASQILEKYLARTRTLSDVAMLKFENAPATEFANRLQTG